MAPIDCPECAGLGSIAFVSNRGDWLEPCPAGCLDEENAAELVAFLIGGWANWDACTAMGAAMERHRLANRIAALVLDYDQPFLPPLVPEADYGDLAVLLSLEVL